MGDGGKRTVAYLHLDAELAELVGGELDGGAEAGGGADIRARTE